jgi:1-acyl-sn-glycerol-3-phosphate acyltransferase
MTSSDRPKRPSARPSARPEGAPRNAPSVRPPAQGAPADTGGSKPARAPEARQAGTKPGTARVSARRGARGAEQAAAKSRPPAVPAKHTGKSRKARRPAPPKASPASGRPAAEPARAPQTPFVSPIAPPAQAANDDGDDVFSAAEPHVALVGLTLSAQQASDDADALPSASVSRLTRGSGSDWRAQEAALKGAQSLLSSDYYVRQYGAHGMRNLSADVDEYGLDPHAEERARPWLELLCTRYFRLDLEGASRIPAEGRALLVANRAGSVPWDGLMLHTALRMQRPELQPVRWLCEDSVIHYPFLGVFMNRLGAVRACPENAERLLNQDRLVAVFPEGAQGSHKLFKDRYRLQRFGRGGYVKLALKLGAPILPTAIIGAEETNPLLARIRLFGRASGDEFLPITPTFPWLGPAGLFPAPVKWRVIIGEPVDLSAYGPEAAEDALVVHRLNEQIRSILQALLDQGTASRRSVLFG